jgi:hypothetical protein
MFRPVLSATRIKMIKHLEHVPERRHNGTVMIYVSPPRLRLLLLLLEHVMCSSKANNRIRSRSLKWKKGFYNNAVFLI